MERLSSPETVILDERSALKTGDKIENNRKEAATRDAEQEGNRRLLNVRTPDPAGQSGYFFIPKKKGKHYRRSKMHEGETNK